MPIISMTARYRPTPMKIIVSVLNARPLIFMVDRPVCEVQLTIRFADVLPADQAVYSNSGTSGHVPRVVEGVWHYGRGAIRVTNDCWRPPHALVKKQEIAPALTQAQAFVFFVRVRNFELPAPASRRQATTFNFLTNWHLENSYGVD